MGDYSSCNGDTFVYQGATSILYVILALDLLMILYLLYKMCVLCSTAFSYSHFHIHETYKLYALALLALFMMGMSRKTQLDLKKYLGLTQDRPVSAVRAARLLSAERSDGAGEYLHQQHPIHPQRLYLADDQPRLRFPRGRLPHQLPLLPH